MYLEQVSAFSVLAQKKVNTLRERPLSILLSGILGGVYIGFGIILIMTIGNEVPPEFRKILMGISFGIALTLIVFAGADLFTGYAMYCSFAVLQNAISLQNALKISVSVWCANLLGAILLAVLYKFSAGELVKNTDTVLHAIALKKMNGAPVSWFFNGVLCNWLVCLALWMSARTQSDTTKCIVIFWCLYAFIASGYEHSVANMAVFALSLAGPFVEGINLVGALQNLLWVTLGNILGGALFLGGFYWYIAAPGKEINQGTELNSLNETK